MSRPHQLRRPSLDLLFTLVLLATAGLLAGLLWFLHSSSQTVIKRSSDLLVELDRTNQKVGEKVVHYFEQAEEIVQEIDTVDYLDLQRFPDDRLRPALRLLLSTASDMSEVSYISSDPPSQISVFRNRQGEVETSRIILHEGKFLELGTGREVQNPTSHPTFQTLAKPEFKGRMLWSDLHLAHLDSQMGVETPRIVVTVQKAIYDTDGKLLGVARVGRFVEELTKVTLEGGEADPAVGKWVFLCDSEGRLVTRLSEADELTEHSDAIRIEPAQAPAEVLTALSGFSKSQDKESRSLSRLESDAGHYLSLFQPISGSQDWYLGVVLPETYFLSDIAQAHRRALLASVLVFLAVLTLGIVILRALRGDIRRLVEGTQSMRRFEFEAQESRTRIADLYEVETGLEGAKASLRALSKYVPMNLVRQLFQQELEPKLGGELKEISLMFTDVAGFTSIAESRTIDELAEKLALYLDRMNGTIQEHDGAILERIGDALLTVWNAPTDCQEHSKRMCEAVLNCLARTGDLDWKTRFGLHRAEVMVGHFGSAQRLNYGLLGDDVNLAARIESLNKHYGTGVLASDNVFKTAQDSFEFRLIDEVAVKGRTSGVKLYELLGRKGEVEAKTLETARAYESAFATYQRGEFREAGELFGRLVDDPASRTLQHRCRSYEKTPPPAEWGGVFVATFK